MTLRVGVFSAFLLAIAFVSCMDKKPVHRFDDLQSLKGKTERDVLALLGSPRVIDSSASSGERIWGYYQMPVVSEDNEKPRHRTVLIVLRGRDADIVVDEVRIP